MLYQRKRLVKKEEVVTNETTRFTWNYIVNKVDTMIEVRQTEGARNLAMFKYLKRIRKYLST